MPNTLAHIGIHSAITRALLPAVAPAWIWLGCVIPDLPWILQRAIKALPPFVSAYDLRLYGTVQASLFGSLFAAAALACLARRFAPVLAALGLGCLLHLLLDSLQTKWGNGVSFLAPFDWRLTNFGLFWPESPITVVLTLSGLIWVAIFGRRAALTAPGLALSLPRLGAALLFAAAWLVLPLLLLEGPYRADNHYVKTLAEREARPGRDVVFHRADWVPAEPEGYLLTMAGEPLGTDDLEFDRFTRVSVRATFVTEDRIRVQAYHVHRAGLRDAASYLGLGAIAVVWIVASTRRSREREGIRAARR